MNPYSQYYINKFHFELDGLRLQTERYERTLGYEKKILLYKSLLRRVEQSLRKYQGVTSTFISVSDEASSDWFELIPTHSLELLRRKQELLERLIGMAELIKFVGDDTDDTIFKNLEKELDSYLDEYDYLIPWIPTGYPVERITFFEEKIRTNHVKITVLLRKIYGRIYRDIRMSIRAMIRFLHISVDDKEDVADDFAFVLSKSFSNSLKPPRWKRKLLLSS